MVLDQVALEVGITQCSDCMKCHGILVRSKPVAFFGEAYCRNVKAGISRAPLRYLPQELRLTHEMRGPIETHRLFDLGRVT